MVGSRQTGILFFSRFGLNKNMSGTVLCREYCFVEVNARTICIREESNGGGILNLFSASQITFQGIHKINIFVGGRIFLLQKKHEFDNKPTLIDIDLQSLQKYFRNLGPFQIRDTYMRTYLCSQDLFGVKPSRLPLFSFSKKT